MCESRVVRYLRAGLRAAALLVLVAVAVCEWVWSAGCRRDPEGRAGWLARLSQRMLRLMGVRVRRSGATPVGGVLLAPNHLGYLDVLVLAACRPVVFVAKREVRGWSVVGWLARAGGTRFIDRRRARDVGRAGGEISEALAKGAGVAVFLEGTSTDGRGVAPFHASLLGRAVEEGWLVAPVALVYRVEAGRSVERDVAWWGDMELAPHLWNLLGLRSVEAEVAFGAAEQARGGRKELAEELRQRVASLKEKVTEVGV